VPSRLARRRTPGQERGPDVVLDLARGKIRAQDAARSSARRANRRLLGCQLVLGQPGRTSTSWPSRRRPEGRLCLRPGGFTNGRRRQPGGAPTGATRLWIRGNGVELAGVTGGNGASTRCAREANIHVDPRMGHDLSFRSNMSSAWSPSTRPIARAEEKMVPSIEGESRKRTDAEPLWQIVLTVRPAGPCGLSPLYALEVYSHRVLQLLDAD